MPLIDASFVGRFDFVFLAMSRTKKLTASFLLVLGLAIAYFQWRLRALRDKRLKLVVWCSNCRKYVVLNMVTDID